jgi:hypothetical protein
VQPAGQGVSGSVVAASEVGQDEPAVFVGFQCGPEPFPRIVGVGWR